MSSRRSSARVVYLYVESDLTCRTDQPARRSAPPERRPKPRRDRRDGRRSPRLPVGGPAGRGGGQQRRFACEPVGGCAHRRAVHRRCGPRGVR